MSEARAISEEKQDTTKPRSGLPELAVRVQTRRSAENQEFMLHAEFRVNPGFTILFGPSGAGKTTLLDCVAGLVKPDSGRISIGERVLFDSSGRVDVPVRKRRVGYVFQNLAVFPHLTVEQNVAFGLAKWPRGQRTQQVSQTLRELRIADLTKRNAREISGGESQRVALARTLVTEPELLLLDEPLAALDAATKGKIIDDLRTWNRTHAIPILYVTHSREEVFALGERVMVLDGGRIQAEGTPHEVMGAPLQETVAQLTGFENVFDAVVEDTHPERGTMRCRIMLHPQPCHENQPPPLLETPLVRASVGSALRVGIRAGDILLAIAPPHGLSARNVIHGVLTSMEQRDVIMVAKVACTVEIEVHLTLAARDALHLEAGREVWLVIKTHSCHLMQK